MSVETKGYVNSKIKGKEIYDVITQEIDKDAVYNFKKENKYYGNGEIGYINFKYNRNNRSMFIIENMSCESSEQGKLFEDDRYTYLSLGQWGHSEEIITIILKAFGGFLDENDCDSIEAWETQILKDGAFEFDEYITERNKIVELMDESFSNADKIKFATTYLKLKDKLENI